MADTHQEASTGNVVKNALTPLKPGQKPEQSKDATGKPTMRVKIYSPYRTYFDDMAYSISGINATGPFDILPRHYNFLSLLSPCILEVKGPKLSRKIKISRGVMHVRSDSVKVFLDV